MTYAYNPRTQRTEAGGSKSPRPTYVTKQDLARDREGKGREIQEEMGERRLQKGIRNKVGDFKKAPQSRYVYKEAMHGMQYNSRNILRKTRYSFGLVWIDVFSRRGFSI